MQNHQHRNKINFNTHIENIISKTTRIKNTLFNFCKNTYGINTRKRQNLYKGLIRPVLTYGSEIWINHITKKQIQKLESTQHQILRHSIMGYKTISKACTTLLTRIEPIHTNIQIKQIKHQVIQVAFTFFFRSLSLSLTDSLFYRYGNRLSISCLFV
mgnify:CR=1 FL=1